VDADGKELDMGTAFDEFDLLSQPALEARFLKEGKLTSAQLANRKLLRQVMQDAGFMQLPLEWWHYDALPADVVRKQYQIIE
jgi:D-alanyl-D-alanine dipeptidase